MAGGKKDHQTLVNKVKRVCDDKKVWYNSRKAAIIHDFVPFCSLASPGTAKHGALYHFAAASWYNDRKAVIILDSRPSGA